MVRERWKEIYHVRKWKTDSERKNGSEKWLWFIFHFEYVLKQHVISLSLPLPRSISCAHVLSLFSEYESKWAHCNTLQRTATYQSLFRVLVGNPEHSGLCFSYSLSFFPPLSLSLSLFRVRSRKKTHKLKNTTHTAIVSVPSLSRKTRAHRFLSLPLPLPFSLPRSLSLFLFLYLTVSIPSPIQKTWAQRTGWPAKSTLQHTATHCNTLQHATTHYNTWVSFASLIQKTWAQQTGGSLASADRKNVLQHTATHCDILQHTATNCKTQQHAVTHQSLFRVWIRKPERSGPEALHLLPEKAYCNTLQHTATHCITLHHTASHCNTLQHTATHQSLFRVRFRKPERSGPEAACICWRKSVLQHPATHCNTLQNTTKHCNALQHTAKHCKTLQHTATRCNTPVSIPSPSQKTWAP